MTVSKQARPRNAEGLTPGVIVTSLSLAARPCRCASMSAAFALSATCTPCHHPRMVEYGNGVGQVAGQAGGGSGGMNDLGAVFAQAISQSIDTIAGWPPGLLLVALGGVLFFLLLLKRAF